MSKSGAHTHDTLEKTGTNDGGQLGYEDTMTRGDGVGPMGDDLKVVDLGEDQRAIAVAAGWYHTCALLYTGDVKCWGETTSCFAAAAAAAAGVVLLSAVYFHFSWGRWIDKIHAVAARTRGWWGEGGQVGQEGANTSFLVVDPATTGGFEVVGRFIADGRWLQRGRDKDENTNTRTRAHTHSQKKHCGMYSTFCARKKRLGQRRFVGQLARAVDAYESKTHTFTPPPPTHTQNTSML